MTQTAKPIRSLQDVDFETLMAIAPGILALLPGTGIAQDCWRGMIQRETVSAQQHVVPLPDQIQIVAYTLKASSPSDEHDEHYCLAFHTGGFDGVYRFTTQAEAGNWSREIVRLVQLREGIELQNLMDAINKREEPPTSEPEPPLTPEDYARADAIIRRFLEEDR